MLFVLEIDEVPSGEFVCLAVGSELRQAAESRRVARLQLLCDGKQLNGTTKSVCFPCSLTQFGSERCQVQVAMLEVQLVVSCNDNTRRLKHLV